MSEEEFGPEHLEALEKSVKQQETTQYNQPPVFAEEPEPEEDPTSGFDGFPDEIRQDVDGLIWLGYLEDSFEFMGHDFTIRTLRGDEELIAGLVSKEYMDTLGQAKAWAWAQVGLALVAVDGDTNFCPPIGPNKKQYGQARFKYVTENWYWPTCQYILNRYALLLDRQTEALEALESLS